jgi:prolyl-tRNA editing enzyme YbaK/EbsC (Cys-tRNA(Pro) deacylase)
MHESVERFIEEAGERGVEVDVHEFPEGTKTAAAAAEAIGCDVAQIASSIAMVADELVVVVTSGANRVDEGALGAVRGVEADAVRTANPGEIKDTLGWSIGGVPPFCHETPVPVYIDETLLAYEEVWAAAGTPQAVFPIDPARIRDVADAAPIDVVG